MWGKIENLLEEKAVRVGVDSRRKVAQTGEVKTFTLDGLLAALST